MRQPLDELLRDLGLLQRDTHRGSPRSARDLALRGWGPGGLGLYGGCRVFVEYLWIKAGKKYTPTPPAPPGAGALPAAPACAPAGAARRLRNCATARPGGRLRGAPACARHSCASSPRAPLDGWKPIPGSRLLKSAQAHRGRGLPRPGEEEGDRVPRGHRHPTSAHAGAPSAKHTRSREKLESPCSAEHRARLDRGHL